MPNSDLMEILKNRTPHQKLDLSHARIEHLDLRHADLSGINFTKAVFVDVNLQYADFSNCNLEEAFFEQLSLKGARLVNCNLRGTDFRFADLEDADISGSYLFGAVLENANLHNVQFDERTRFFKLYCPAEGAFLGYKKCFNERLVQLLIPADAKRTSSTMNTCRCDKAKVLSIKSLDGKENFSEATSYVDENFVYRVGEYVFAENFNEDRWFDSTTGIHFWLTREEAAGYM